MQIGQLFRYSRPNSHEPTQIDGLPNFFAATYTPGQKLAKLDAGINPIAEVSAVDGARRPAILIGSSPHKRGTRETPWHDTFEPDNGYVLYYGDNKSRDSRPESVTGNAVLLAQFRLHSAADPAERRQAAPLIFWERRTHEKKQKGHVVFMGFGVITKADLVTQVNPRTGEYFPNYRWEFAVFTMKFENEDFSWNWISARRDRELTREAAERAAPKAWRDWVAGGPAVLERCRRRVMRLPIVPENQQRPNEADPEFATLRRVYERYSTSRNSFENLASFVCARYLRRNSVRYTEGWVTPAGSDGGVDFVGRIDLGIGLGRCRLVILGQAKCESLESPTNGVHVARTVARLRRGWIGVYVTTSYFSEKVQREIASDEFPVVLIGGKELANELQMIVHEEGFSSLDAMLDVIDGQYTHMKKRADPDAVIREEFTAYR